MNQLFLSLAILLLTPGTVLAQTFYHSDAHQTDNPLTIFSSDVRTDRFDLDIRDRYYLEGNQPEKHVKFLIADRYGLDDTTQPSRRAGSASR